MCGCCFGFEWGGGGGLGIRVTTVHYNCTLNLSQKRCFTFYSFLKNLFVYFYLCYVDLSNCSFCCGIQVTQMAHFHFMHLLGSSFLKVHFSNRCTSVLAFAVLRLIGINCFSNPGTQCSGTDHSVRHFPRGRHGYHRHHGSGHCWSILWPGSSATGVARFMRGRGGCFDVWRENGRIDQPQ